MMKLDQRLNRWTALMVLVLILVIVYFLMFHQFFVSHSGLNETINDLDVSRQKYINQAVKTPDLKEKLRKVKAMVGDNEEFLKAETTNLGNAEITSILKQIVNEQIVNEQGVESSECQIVSQQPSQDRNPDQFEKVLLRVRMRCQFEIFSKILSRIEENIPLLFVKDLRIEAQNISRYRRNKNKDAKQAPGNLEIRFELYAYLKNAIEKEDEK